MASFEGVGIQLNQDEKTKEVEIITPIEGSPAFKAGVYAGDVILKVNGEIGGRPFHSRGHQENQGKVNTSVTLRVRHTTGEEVDLTMNREEIVVPTVKGFNAKPIPIGTGMSQTIRKSATSASRSSRPIPPSA